VGLASELGHRGRLEIGGQFEFLAVQGVDLLADGFVLVGDDSIGDARVDKVISIERWPSSVAIASRRIPRLMAWVARVWRS
jgi:hypothetical protein